MPMLISIAGWNALHRLPEAKGLIHGSIHSLKRGWVITSKFKSTHPDEAGSNERWMQSADGWIEVELYENDIISGLIYMQSSLNTKTEKFHSSMISDMARN